MNDRDMDTEQLRAEIDQQRAAISSTVGQIEDRVSPGRIMARRRDRMRRRFTDAKDSIFGNDDPDYWYTTSSGPYTHTHVAEKPTQEGSNRMSAAGETATHAAESLQHMPQTMRRQTRGNPMAAGMVALGAGWLIGSLLPQTRKETDLARRIEPEITEAATAIRDEGMELADDMKEPAKEAAEDVKRTGRQAATSVKEEVRTNKS